MVSDFLHVLALALMPAFGRTAGGVLAELIPASPRILSRALHAAAGVVLAVIAVELIPEALAGSASPWGIVAGFCLGGGFYVLLEWIIDRLQAGKGEKAGSAWMIYAAVAIDLFSDGLMIGVGSVVSLNLALILAVGQLAADMPEGFPAMANFKNKGQPRMRRLFLSVCFAAPCLLGASLGYWLLRGGSETLQLAGLAFVAGILLLAAIEEMLKETHEVSEDTRLSAIFFVGGFALFMLVAAYFER